MSRIGIDVDGVLRDFCGDLETIIKKEFPQYIPEGVTDFKINDWKISNCVSCSKEDVQQIYWYTHCDKIMANGNPMYGAIKKMYDLINITSLDRLDNHCYLHLFLPRRRHLFFKKSSF